MFRFLGAICFNSSVGRAQGWKLWGRWFDPNLKHMNTNFKLYFKYILLHTNQVFLYNLLRHDMNTNILVTQKSFYYLMLHFKLSSLFYSLQLSDLFSYELPVNKNNAAQTSTHFTSSTSVIVYNFHLLSAQQRFFIFVLDDSKTFIQKNNNRSHNCYSLTELFLNANWLEREAAELNAINFVGKKDLRNLMLQYGDVSAPFQKSFPSIGVREIFYDTITDNLTQSPVSIQF